MKKPTTKAANQAADTEKARATRRPPTAEEVTAIGQAKHRRLPQPARVEVSMELDGGQLTVANPHSDIDGWSAHLKDTFGTTSHAFVDQAFGRLEVIARAKDAPAAKGAPMNGALALMAAIAPSDELEAAIGEQIVAAHLVSMEFLAKAKHTDTMCKLEAYTNMATKLSRTMAAQVEALAKLRSGGKQQVIVKHVYVNGDAYVGDNGQAAFGGIGAQGGGAGRGKSSQAREPIGEAADVDAVGPEVWSQDPRRDALPRPRDEDAAALQAPWRQGDGRADGEGERALQDRPLDEGTAGGAGVGPRRRSQHAA